jgi:hypothetical protein
MSSTPFKQRLLLATAPTLAAWALKGLSATWRVRHAGFTANAPWEHPKEPKIFAIWHETALAAGAFRNLPLHALASQSFDGELISRLLLKMGYLEPARGSSSRGGDAALLEMQGFLGKGEHVLLTVDGPRGPRHHAKAGAVKLATLTGRAVVPVAFTCSPCLRLHSWDRMIVPPPFCKAVFYFGEEQHFKASKDPDLITKDLERFQKCLDRATARAQAFL